MIADSYWGLVICALFAACLLIALAQTIVHHRRTRKPSRECVRSAAPFGITPAPDETADQFSDRAKLRVWGSDIDWSHGGGWKNG